jgi:hypothetical protein
MAHHLLQPSSAGQRLSSHQSRHAVGGSLAVAHYTHGACWQQKTTTATLQHNENERERKEFTDKLWCCPCARVCARACVCVCMRAFIRGVHACARLRAYKDGVRVRVAFALVVGSVASEHEGLQV